MLTVGSDFPWATAVGYWTDLIRVEFIVPTAGFNIGFLDNVVVDNVVPIPAAVWLFGSGLGLLGWFSRKARKAKQIVMDWSLPPDCLEPILVLSKHKARRC